MQARPCRCRRSSVVERPAHNRSIDGSNPSGPTPVTRYIVEVSSRPQSGQPAARAILSLDRNRPPCPSRSVLVPRSVRLARLTESRLSPSRRASAPIARRRLFQSTNTEGAAPEARPSLRREAYFVPSLPRSTCEELIQEGWRRL